MRVRGHRHIGFGRHHKGELVLVQPPQIAAIQKALIEDHLVQPGGARQIARKWLQMGNKDSADSPCRQGLSDKPEKSAEWIYLTGS